VCVPAPGLAAGAGSGRRSLCERYGEQIEGKLEVGLSAKRIHQDLVAEVGFGGSYDSVKRLCRHLAGARGLPPRRLECEPGEEVQVDFGRGAPLVQGDGRRRYPHLFRIVLSYSRKAYSEVVPRQTTEHFIRALENAFRHFGGVTRTIVTDNLKAAVKKADWFDPELNPKVPAFCEHYGTALLPARPRHPEGKGKVERSVDYAQENALKGRTFTSLQEQNQFLRHWEDTVADTRIHGTTKRQVRAAFEQERPALLPLPLSLFPCFEEGKRTVHRDAHIEVDKAYYSVPVEYLRREVWARWDGRLVRVYNQRFEQIAIHARRPDGKFSTLPEHIPAEKISGIERGTEWMLRRAALMGAHCEEWARAMLANRGIYGLRVLQGLLSLAGKHPARRIDDACRKALACETFRLRDLRRLFALVEEQPELPFLDTHPLIRNLNEYSDLVAGCGADLFPVAHSERHHP
jgi:transposase